MADKKISALPAASTPLAGTEVLPIVQGGTTDQVSVANLTAGRAISAAQLTLSTENLVIGTAGKGIDFSANTAAAGMTSELLSWYEEGNWTPVVTAAVGTITSYTASGNYTRIGRQVTVNMNIIITANGTGSAALKIAGLPFNAATVRYDAGAGEEYVATGNAVVMTFQTTGQLLMVNYNNTYPGGDGYYIAASITYNA
jgi:hypothetical protein